MYSCIYVYYLILYRILRAFLTSFDFSPRRFRSISPPTAWLTRTTVRPLDKFDQDDNHAALGFMNCTLNISKPWLITCGGFPK